MGTFDSSQSMGVSGAAQVAVALPNGTTATTQPSFNNSTDLATTQYVDAAVYSGGYVYIEEDFTFANTNNSVTTAAVYAADTSWEIMQVNGGTQSFASQAGTYQNPGQLLITTSATTNDGAVLARAGNGCLGVLGNGTGWQYDCWFQLPSTITNYCLRAGILKGAQQNADAPNSGFWVEYDTANASSNSTFQYRTVQSSTSTYTNSSVTPAASTWYHVRISSQTAGTISFQIGTANGALSSATNVTSNVDTTSGMTLFVQVLPRSNAAVTLTLDRITYIAATGRQ